MEEKSDINNYQDHNVISSKSNIEKMVNQINKYCKNINKISLQEIPSLNPDNFFQMESINNGNNNLSSNNINDEMTKSMNKKFSHETKLKNSSTNGNCYNFRIEKNFNNGNYNTNKVHNFTDLPYDNLYNFQDNQYNTLFIQSPQNNKKKEVNEDLSNIDANKINPSFYLQNFRNNVSNGNNKNENPLNIEMEKSKIENIYLEQMKFKEIKRVSLNDTENLNKNANKFNYIPENISNFYSENKINDFRNFQNNFKKNQIFEHDNSLTDQMQFLDKRSFPQDVSYNNQSFNQSFNEISFFKNIPNGMNLNMNCESLEGRKFFNTDQIQILDKSNFEKNHKDLQGENINNLIYSYSPKLTNVENNQNYYNQYNFNNTQEELFKSNKEFHQNIQNFNGIENILINQQYNQNTNINKEMIKNNIVIENYPQNHYDFGIFLKRLEHDSEMLNLFRLIANFCNDNNIEISNNPLFKEYIEKFQSVVNNYNKFSMNENINKFNIN